MGDVPKAALVINAIPSALTNSATQNRRYRLRRNLLILYLSFVKQLQSSA